MKKFNIPDFYKSGIISELKNKRKLEDPRKQDFSPTYLNFGKIGFYIARHFGFCYGVENAIEIAYKTIEENPDKNIYLLSEMIHNPEVNNDLRENGVKFIMDTEGNQFIPFDSISSKDLVIIPAFGTTVEIENLLKEKGIDTVKFNTTCPFVEKVWNRAAQLGKNDYTVIIHGKHKHEETRATFSHSKQNAPSVIIKNLDEANLLGLIISGEIERSMFYKIFNGKYSSGFDVDMHLNKIGVVNQTTMLASETQDIADHLKKVMTEKYGSSEISEHFADTRDTLCYATNDNQSATYRLLTTNADFAIVVGGYNSSNTSHIVELLEEQFPTYFINSDKTFDSNKIEHFDIHSKSIKITDNFIPEKNMISVVLTSGASCPDSLVEKVLRKFLSFFENSKTPDEIIAEITR